MKNAMSARGKLTCDVWPAHDPDRLARNHPDLPPDHPHLHAHDRQRAHALVIDELHKRWPRGVAR